MANELTLIGEIVTLIPMTVADKDAFFQLATQSDGSDFWYDAKQKASRTKDKFFSDWTEGYFNLEKVNDGQCFWIFVADRRIGQVNYNEIDTQNMKTELDIIIGRNADMGHGYGTDALRTLTKYLFEMLHLHKIWIEARASNDRAIKAYKKAGFQTEASLKDEYYFEGQFVNAVRLMRIQENAL